MHSKKKHEGYLLVDNRHAPTDLPAQINGRDVLGGNGVQEFATLTCSHCQQVFLKNTDRVRERAYCRKCDHYICDACGAIAAQTLQCVTMKQRLDQMQERAFLAEQKFL